MAFVPGTPVVAHGITGWLGSLNGEAGIVAEPAAGGRLRVAWNSSKFGVKAIPPENLTITGPPRPELIPKAAITDRPAAPAQQASHPPQQRQQPPASAPAAACAWSGAQSVSVPSGGQEPQFQPLQPAAAGTGSRPNVAQAPAPTPWGQATVGAPPLQQPVAQQPAAQQQAGAQIPAATRWSAVPVSSAQVQQPVISAVPVTPHTPDELRIDKTDGRAYTKHEFFVCYGGVTEWDAAERVAPELAQRATARAAAQAGATPVAVAAPAWRSGPGVQTAVPVSPLMGGQGGAQGQAPQAAQPCWASPIQQPTGQAASYLPQAAPAAVPAGQYPQAQPWQPPGGQHTQQTGQAPPVAQVAPSQGSQGASNATQRRSPRSADRWAAVAPWRPGGTQASGTESWRTGATATAEHPPWRTGTGDDTMASGHRTEDTTQWPCGRCGFHNPPTDDSCSMCGVSRGARSGWGTEQVNTRPEVTPTIDGRYRSASSTSALRPPAHQMAHPVAYQRQQQHNPRLRDDDHDERREDPAQPKGSTRYSLSEFIDFYGEEKGRRYWQRAENGFKYPRKPEPVELLTVRPQGKRVADYEMGKQIAVGTFSVVHAAYHSRTKREYAIKIIEKGSSPEGKNKEAVEREVRWEVSLMRLLSHPNIVKLIEGFESPDRFFIVLESVRGGDLATRLNHARNRRLTEPVARGIWRGICEGIIACHQSGVAHRDIRPENCLISEDGAVKVTDFGVSAWHRDTQVDLNEDCGVGTVHYCAPEVIYGSYNAFLADFFSAGCVLFQTLTGYYAYGRAGQSEEQVEEALMRGSFNQYPSHLGEAAMDLLGRLLKTEPLQRINLRQAVEHQWNRGPSEPLTHGDSGTESDNLPPKGRGQGRGAGTMPKRDTAPARRRGAGTMPKRDTAPARRRGAGTMP
eukprot:Hpha_TRINITY_DN15587_c1_g1::TRINITY_DN15587_c1_g1_i1::g.108446::m.108446